MQDKTGLPLKLLGGGLLALLIGWIVLSVAFWHTSRTHPRIVAGGAAFEGNLQLPKGAIDHTINAARDHMDRLYDWSERLRVSGEIVDWAGFLCTALITLFAGYFGITIPAAGGTPEVQAIVSGRSARFAKTVGLLAALAAICTAASSRIKVSSEQDYKRATEMQVTITTVRKNVYDAKDAASAQIALDVLDTLR
jgi:hypothetical protein